MYIRQWPTCTTNIKINIMFLNIIIISDKTVFKVMFCVKLHEKDASVA